MHCARSRALLCIIGAVRSAALLGDFETLPFRKRKSPQKFGDGQSLSPRALQLGHNQDVLPTGDAKAAATDLKHLTRGPLPGSGGATPDLEIKAAHTRVRARRRVECANPAIHARRTFAPVHASFAPAEFG